MRAMQMHGSLNPMAKSLQRQSARSSTILNCASKRSRELSRRLAALSIAWPNSAGLSAAIASFNDHAFLKTTRAALTADRAKVHATLDRMGLKRADAQGNFVFFDTGGPLQRFQERMLAEGMKVGRRFDGYDTWARVTIGLHEEVDQFLHALPRALSRQ